MEELKCYPYKSNYRNYESNVKYFWNCYTIWTREWHYRKYEGIVCIEMMGKKFAYYEEIYPLLNIKKICEFYFAEKTR